MPASMLPNKGIALDRAAISVSRDMTFLPAARQLNAVVRRRKGGGT